MRTFEERTFYALIVRLKGRSTKEMPAALAKLPAFYQKLIEEGRYIAAGEWDTSDGGMVLFRAEDSAEAGRVARSHPFHGKKFAELELRAWRARWALWNLMGAGKKVRR